MGLKKKKTGNFQIQMPYWDFFLKKKKKERKQKQKNPKKTENPRNNFQFLRFYAKAIRIYAWRIQGVLFQFHQNIN